jgi:hypothetical protein
LWVFSNAAMRGLMYTSGERRISMSENGEREGVPGGIMAA